MKNIDNKKKKKRKITPGEADRLLAIYFLWSWPWYIGATPREQDLEEGDSGVEAT